jgi:hypothetical protein
MTQPDNSTRPRPIERLNAGLQRKMMLAPAPAASSISAPTSQLGWAIPELWRQLRIRAGDPNAGHSPRPERRSKSGLQSRHVLRAAVPNLLLPSGQQAHRTTGTAANTRDPEPAYPSPTGTSRPASVRQMGHIRPRTSMRSEYARTQPSGRRLDHFAQGLGSTPQQPTLGRSAP